MFIRLTQLDGKSIWFNSAYIVTVEPRKGSGALVVPLGDGLDYDVIESPAQIVEALGGSISPVPEPKRRSDGEKAVSSADGQLEEPAFSVILSSPAVAVPRDGDETVAVPARKTRGRTAKKSAKESDGAAAKKPAKKTAKASAKSAKKVKLPPIPLTEEQLMRLQKMSPGSMKKLVNTLMSQFGVAETENTVDALRAREIISVTDQGHVEWNWRKVDPPAGAK